MRRSPSDSPLDFVNTWGEELSMVAAQSYGEGP